MLRIYLFFLRRYLPYVAAITGGEFALLFVDDRLGFDTVWLSEHHFWFDGYCPADLVVAGAILARTQKLAVGTAVMLLPMHSVQKVADDARVLSQIGGGRLALGVALGYRDAEFDGFGLRRRDRGKRMDAQLPELAAACRETGFPGYAVRPRLLAPYR